MKKFLIIFVLVAALALAVFYYLHQNKLKDFEPQIKEKLNKLVMEASNGLYHLDIERLETDIVTSKISLVNAHLRPDTLVYAQLEKARMAPDDIFDITVAALLIDNIAPADFLANKSINLGKLFINNPVLNVWHKKQSYNVSDMDSSKTTYEKISKDISSIRIDTLMLQNINFIYTNKSLNNKQTKISNVKLFFSDILLDSSTQRDQHRILFAKNCLVSLKDYTINTSDSLYQFKIGDIEIQTSTEAMQLKKLQFIPRLPALTFYRRIKHQQDRFEIAIDLVNFSKVKWWSILADQSFIVKKVSMNNGTIKIFNDKSQPVDVTSKVGKYPHQLLMKLPYILKLDTLAVSNIDLSYTELNPKSGEKGTINFDNIRGLLTNITNDPEQIRKDRYTRVTADALFMKKSPVTAAFVFDLAKYKDGNFNLTASLGAIGADAINPITVPLGMLKINSVNIKSLDVSIKGDNNKATGTVKMVYDHLNITALKSADDTLKKRAIISFIANTFVIKKENPLNNGPVRTVNASFPRNTHRSFFNLVWKTIFTGAGNTVGYKVKK